MDHPDMAYQVLPWYQLEAVSWHRGELPLWDPHVWGGQPLVGQLQPGAAYPPNWLLFLLPLRNGHIQQVWLHLYFIVAHLFAALACYWLCRDLGRTVSASILAGSAFAGTFLGISFLSGHHQIPTFTSAMMAALWLFEFSRWRLRALRPAGL